MPIWPIIWGRCDIKKWNNFFFLVLLELIQDNCICPGSNCFFSLHFFLGHWVSLLITMASCVPISSPCKNKKKTPQNVLDKLHLPYWRKLCKNWIYNTLLNYPIIKFFLAIVSNFKATKWMLVTELLVNSSLKCEVLLSPCGDLH